MDEAIGDPGPAGAARALAATPVPAGFRQRPPGGYDSRRARIVSIVSTGIWLLYLIGPVVDLFTRHHSMAYTWVGFAIIMVFSAIYIVIVPRWPTPPRYVLHGLAALGVLAVVACVIYGGSGSTALWIFVASASGLLVPDYRWAFRAVCVCIGCYVLFSLTGHVPTTDFLGDLLPAVFVGFGMIGLRRQFQLTAELGRAREEVAQLAASEERLRLARDMHDLTGQSLSMITLKSELAARLLSRLPAQPERDRVRDEIEQVAAVSRQTLHDIREAVSGYRRPTLAVEIITARAALASAGITTVDDAGLTLLSGTFDPDAEAALAWCLREAVTNVVRHSSSRTCHIGLAGRPDGMTLTVRDDGQGHVPAAGKEPCPGGPFTPPQGTPRVRSGTGLRGMSERLSAVGGTLELRPDLSPGFALIATIPIGVPAPAAGPVRSRAPVNDRLDEARR